jgi:hypothetical protein
VTIRALAVFIREFDLVLPKCPTDFGAGHRSGSAVGLATGPERVHLRDLRTTVALDLPRRNSPAKSMGLLVNNRGFTKPEIFACQAKDVSGDQA